MRRVFIVLLTMCLVVALMSPVAAANDSPDYDPLLAVGSPLNNAFENGQNWVLYGNVYVEWTWDGTGYQYTWETDRDLDGYTIEGWVEVDYGRYYDYMRAQGYPDADNDGLIERYESGTLNWYYETGAAYYSGKVEHLSMDWVTGVTVPGGENQFIIKCDKTGTTYVGGFQTPLFWDYMTIQGNPAGPYQIMNKFYYLCNVGTNGLVTSGYYIEYQYMAVPDIVE